MKLGVIFTYYISIGTDYYSFTTYHWILLFISDSVITYDFIINTYYEYVYYIIITYHCCINDIVITVILPINSCVITY
jgi:hypothetical protein